MYFNIISSESLFHVIFSRIFFRDFFFSSKSIQLKLFLKSSSLLRLLLTSLWASAILASISLNSSSSLSILTILDLNIAIWLINNCEISVSLVSDSLFIRLSILVFKDSFSLLSLFILLLFSTLSIEFVKLFNLNIKVLIIYSIYWIIKKIKI